MVFGNHELEETHGQRTAVSTVRLVRRGILMLILARFVDEREEASSGDAIV